MITCTLTVKQMTDWILEHRKGDAFKDYPPNKIAGAISNATTNPLGVFSYYTSDSGDVEGVVIGEKIDRDIIFIHDILCLNHKALVVFLKKFIEFYPGYKIMGKAHDRIRIFVDPIKLLKKL